MSKPVEKPPIQREQSWGAADKPRGAEMKKSILADVNKQIVVNTSGKSGGS